VLEAAGLEAYAPCIPGWGFTDTSNMRAVDVDGKRAALLAFHEQVLGGRPAVWVGASLGACIALDCYKASPSAFSAMVNLDPGFFTDAPPAVPAFVGRLLLQNVLSSPRVRESIAKQAYSVKDLQTEDAIRCGNLHLNRPAWEDDSLEWLLGGAYGGIAVDVPRLAQIPTLTLWGRQDEVISPAATVPQLTRALPDASFRWVESSGHTPHLEQPAYTGAAISAFVRGETVAGDADVSDVLASFERLETLKAKASELGSAAAVKAGELSKMALDKAKEAFNAGASS
jgi:pimeloyl-ACP methyl ester carboxylesterase